LPIDGQCSGGVAGSQLLLSRRFQCWSVLANQSRTVEEATTPVRQPHVPFYSALNFYICKPTTLIVE
jgi:hypothetical protein